MVLHALILLATAQPAADPAAPGLVVLERHCIECHNPTDRKGDLDLTTRDAALRGGSKGPALVAGEPGASLLLDLVEHRRQPHMPRRRPRLAQGEAIAVADWIAAGAPYPHPLRPARAAAGEDGAALTAAERSHWAYRPLADPPPPPGAAANPVDRFVAAALRARGIEPAPAADRRTLLRRAHHTLIGLPPTPAEAAAFLDDRAADAYEKLVDRLLDSPHFGERWARHWLDVARYADSGGYEFDVERPDAWPYRDFVIDALQRDMPFDRFVRWQIAGDELAPDDPAARAATGFLCAGPTISNQETEQNRYDELDDIVSTTGLAFLGLTVGCARCHDHKFDAIPTRDYYRLVAVFNDCKRQVVPYASEAEVAEHQARRQAHDELVADAERRLADLTAPVRTRLRRAAAAALDLDPGTAELLALTEDPSPQPVWRYTIDEPAAEWCREDFAGEPTWSQGPAPFGQGRDDVVFRTPWTSPRIWLRRSFDWPDPAAPLAFAAYHDEDLEIWVNGVLAARASGYTVDYVALDASAAAQAALRAGRNVVAVHCRQTAGAQVVDVVPVDRREFDATAPRDAVRTPWQRVHDLHAELRIDEADLRAALQPAERGRYEELSQWLRRLRRSRPEPLPRALIMTDAGRVAGKAWLLGRGNPADKRAEIDPGFLRVITPVAAQAAFLAAAPPAPRLETTGRRAALARWLTDVEHGAGGLLARVIVNRLWHHHFGRGLVATPNDFGTQGEPPSHPELLDWLAARLIDGGWRLRAIHRLIVTSETYRRAGRSAAGSLAGAELDPDNRLWWHRPPLRLDAEAMRDALLTVSGCLNRRVGGPSVKPRMHPDAIATGSTKKWPTDVRDGPETWRRSLYVFMRRSVRLPMLEVFDAPDAMASCGRRSVTTTPLQALALLSDEFARDQARAMAQAVAAQAVAAGAGSDPDAAIDAAWLRGLYRRPAPAELAAARGFLAAQTERHGGDAAAALADLCQVLFNLNEFAYVD